MRVSTGGRGVTRGFARFLFVLAPLVALVACGGDPGGITGYWKYDEAASVARQGDSKAGGANLKKNLAGMAAVLEFHRDNSYHLTITGGPEPKDETGIFRAGNGRMFLVPKNRNGAAVPAGESEVALNAPDSKHLELPVKGYPAVLVPAPIPGK